MGIYTPWGYIMDGKDRRQIVNRFKRIEGQIRGLEKMIVSEAPCLDILTQVSAVSAAIKKAGSEVVRIYMDQCLVDTANKSEADREKKKKEFQKALARYIDMT
jgi:CsoR family transcriptional regulator, copper-sensing transcriptional repressor